MRHTVQQRICFTEYHNSLWYQLESRAETMHIQPVLRGHAVKPLRAVCSSSRYSRIRASPLKLSMVLAKSEKWNKIQTKNKVLFENLSSFTTLPSLFYSINPIKKKSLSKLPSNLKIFILFFLCDVFKERWGGKRVVTRKTFFDKFFFHIILLELLGREVYCSITVIRLL